MTSEQFCYWLQGFGELTPEPPTPEQWASIKEHLGLVFQKVTRPAPGQYVPNSQEHIRQWGLARKLTDGLTGGDLVVRC